MSDELEPKRLSLEWHARECDNDAESHEEDARHSSGDDYAFEMTCAEEYRDRADKLRELEQRREMMAQVEFSGVEQVAMDDWVACCKRPDRRTPRPDGRVRLKPLDEQEPEVGLWQCPDMHGIPLNVSLVDDTQVCDGTLAAKDQRIADLEAENQDWRDDHQKVLDDKCPSDEHHCSCVVILKARIKELEDHQTKSQGELK